MSRLFIICFARLTGLLMCNLHISHCQSVWWGRIIEGLIFVSTCFVNVFGLILGEYKNDSFFQWVGAGCFKRKENRSVLWLTVLSDMYCRLLSLKYFYLFEFASTSSTFNIDITTNIAIQRVNRQVLYSFANILFWNVQK